VLSYAFLGFEMMVGLDPISSSHSVLLIVPIQQSRIYEDLSSVECSSRPCRFIEGDNSCLVFMKAASHD